MLYGMYLTNVFAESPQTISDNDSGAGILAIPGSSKGRYKKCDKWLYRGSDLQGFHFSRKKREL